MGQEPKKLTPSKSAKDRFGSEVRRYRDLERISIAALANKIPYSASYIGDVERGDSGCVREFAEACDSVLNTREALQHLWDALFATAGSPVPEWFTTWPKIVDDAVLLRVYDPMVVYGMLQTPEYADVVLFGDRAKIENRLARQAVLTKANAPRLVYVLPEWVLHHDIGGPEVMAAQLERLCEAASPRVTIQVVPNGQPHQGDRGSFTLATLPNGAEFAYMETAVRGMILGNPDDLAQLRDQFESIRSHALPSGMSIDLIKRTMEDRWKI
jgi:transcriptional regulator with XRE-family HTH domain